MHRWLIAGIALVWLPSLAAAPVITLAADGDAVRRCGDAVRFILTAEDGGGKVDGGATLRISRDGGETILERPIDFSADCPLAMEATLDSPGFLRAELSGYQRISKPATPKLYPRAAVAFEPEKIRPGFDLPDDFLAFWSEGRAAVAGKHVELTPLDPPSAEGVRAYRVAVEVLHGEKLYGFLSIPDREGRFPALVMVPSAGPGVSKPNVEWAARGVIVLTMNVHKFEAPPDYRDLRIRYDGHNRTLGFPYCYDGAGDRDRYHFRNVILGVDRAVEMLAARPEWDREHLVADGFSQGGGIALILGGFNAHITAVCAAVPALCDHGGILLNRQSGWPGLLQRDPASRSVAPYYDAANFARFINVPLLASVGFIDTTCPPSSVYAAFNLAGGDKRMIRMRFRAHERPPDYLEQRSAWLDARLGLNRAFEAAPSIQ
jgi:cephalosporin-C deacetylase-like acetyl esterase